jgi:outer membrane receptor protein involved in Fe transport
MRRTVILILIFMLPSLALWGQSPTATIDGRVLDPQKAVIEGATIHAINVDTNVQYAGQTNSAGLFTIVNLPPGNYRIEVSKAGFRTIVNPGVVLHIQDVVALNFDMPVGSILESITVTGGASLVNTEDARVSTVVDRNFAENLPMNGRSFQTLIQLTPGVVTVPSNGSDGGQFSVNGQRAAANYWMVDGVSANIGVPALFTSGNGISGALPSFSAQGGTNSLVSVDALQEFRIQTSTYAPEFGRTPGGQISIVTRSGTNQFHGSLFDYFRNDVLDANDWFADNNGLPKPQERQNDFGGSLGGRLIKDRTFFFFSYEALRLRLPQVVESNVPDLLARQTALPSAQPFLNAFPLPTPGAPDDPVAGISQFNASFSNSSTLDAVSLRIDHKLNEKIGIFARYNYSPSTLNQRGSFGALSQDVPSRITTQTATAGATWLISPQIANDLRFNYSKTSGNGHADSTAFGGAVPLSTLPFPSPFTAQNGSFQYVIFSLDRGLNFGLLGQNTQRQINLTDSMSVQKGSHSLKFGADFRRLSPSFQFPQYIQEVLFFDVPSAASGSPFLSGVSSDRPGSLLFHNLGAFAQDTWRFLPRLTLTYGLRWDVDFAPSSGNDVNLAAVTGYNLHDLSALALAPAGEPPFRTTYGNIAPRLGMAYQISQNPNWQTVLRGGFGVFYDLATSEYGNTLHEGFYPFGAIKGGFGGNFPLDPASAAPPPITSDLSSGDLFAFDPHLKLPYTLQWNIAMEQALGSQQAVSASYVGSIGRRLMQSTFVSAPNPNIGATQLTNNAATSDYDSLQLKYERRLSHHLQALASYVWSHSIDTASAGSVFGNESNAGVPSIDPQANRGPSDFDVRNAFSAGATYDIPPVRTNRLVNAILGGWSLQNLVQARSAPPVDVYDSNFFRLLGSTANVRPDLVPGIPLYLFGRQYPGGKAFNNTPGQGGPGCVGPFCPPPTDANGTVLRQGNLSRNSLRGFGAVQWDFAVHRDFPIRESVKLQFRAEMFNVLNHPNFGPPVADISNAMQFGQSVQMLGRSLDQANQAGGSFSPLYQIGGPRSIQLALKLQF